MDKIEKTKAKNRFFKILKVIEVIIMLIVLFICTVIVVQRVTNNTNTFLGFRIFKVETGSMIPKYNIADVILVREKTIDKIEVGDDLVYQGELAETKGKVITHQVIRIEEDEKGEKVFYTKGIANKKEDPVVYGHQILGVVQQKLYTVTLLMNLLLNRYTLYFIIILPFTIYIFFQELYGKEKKMRQEIRTRNKKAHEKEEKESKKRREKEEKIAARRLGTRDIKRLGSKESTQKIDKEETRKTTKKESTKKESTKKD